MLMSGLIKEKNLRSRWKDGITENVPLANRSRMCYRKLVR